MIVITGAAGFIGSAMISHLINSGHKHIIAVDEFQTVAKNKNLASKEIHKLIDRSNFIQWLTLHASSVEAIFHLGARTDTTEFDQAIFQKLNVDYTKAIWNCCTQHSIPLLYASSAATYGAGEHGYTDNHDGISLLKPLNPYGDSKQIVDEWILEQNNTPPNWYGYKFFNVYGPNEYHKGRMASVVFHAYHQIQKTGGMKLFRSHREDVDDGFQSRDFIYVKDVIDVLYWFYKNKPENGIYNLGTGTARPFLHLTQAVFSALELEENISYIDTPEDIRDTYQYFTEANMQKLKATDCPVEFTPLENGVKDYVQSYLVSETYL